MGIESKVILGSGITKEKLIENSLEVGWAVLSIGIVIALLTAGINKLRSKKN